MAGMLHLLKSVNNAGPAWTTEEVGQDNTCYNYTLAGACMKKT